MEELPYDEIQETCKERPRLLLLLSFCHCFSSDLIFGDLVCRVWVVLVVEMHIIDRVLLIHPIIHMNVLKDM